MGKQHRSNRRHGRGSNSVHVRAAGGIRYVVGQPDRIVQPFIDAARILHVADLRRIAWRSVSRADAPAFRCGRETHIRRRLGRRRNAHRLGWQGRGCAPGRPSSCDRSYRIRGCHVDDGRCARPGMVSLHNACRHRSDDDNRCGLELEPAVARIGHAGRSSDQRKHAARYGYFMDHRTLRPAPLRRDQSELY